MISHVSICDESIRSSFSYLFGSNYSFLSSQLRSSAIATYAICGFANPGSLGILIGMITVICPEKQRMAATVGIRAFIAGSFVNFLNASIAGLYNYSIFLGQ